MLLRVCFERQQNKDDARFASAEERLWQVIISMRVFFFSPQAAVKQKHGRSVKAPMRNCDYGEWHGGEVGGIVASQLQGP